MSQFSQKLKKHAIVLKKDYLEVLQVNVGKLCNLTCVHCHVEAGPSKTKENMDGRTAQSIMALIDSGAFHTLDLTGGAPELNPYFRPLVEKARKVGMRVIDRCNLTILFESGQEDLAAYLAEQKVEVVASLPCYSIDNVDKQRGQGTFRSSIEALLLLNRLGYGRDDALQLHLVYNPIGPHLPPAQYQLEKQYKQRLQEDFGITFNRLFTITNMPITRYAKYLKAFEQYDDYVELLINSFNVSTVDGLMCRNTLSVGWDGQIYDCDFNQMLGMNLAKDKPLTVHDLNIQELLGQSVLTADHCFGCTAGAGSSCQGSLE